MKFSLSDWAVTVLAGLLSVILLYFFISDLYALTNHGNEPAVGTIYFKKQTATRKSANSQMWERLQNQSPVYQSDMLRTAEDSEAVLNFEDGLSLDMLQNTMLKLNVVGRSRNLDFQEGSVTLHGGSESSAPVLLGTTGQTVSLSSDAQLVVSKKNDSMSLELSQGTASVSDASGNKQALSTTTALDVNTKTGKIAVRPVDLIPRSPEQGGRLLSLVNGNVPVGFLYQVTSGVKTSGGSVEIQLSRKSDFSSVETHTSGQVKGQDRTGPLFAALIPLEPGTWYWRLATPEATYSSVRQFSLDRDEPFKLVEPESEANFAFRKKLPQVRFSWSGQDHVAYWDLELSAGQPDFKAPKIRKRTSLTSLSLDGLGPGTWYWQVVPHYSSTLVSAAQGNVVRRFTVTKRQGMEAIVPTVPAEGTLFQTQELSSKGLSFTWIPVAEAAGYELVGYRSGAQNDVPIARFKTTSPYKIISPSELGALADVGVSNWALRWVDDENNYSPVSAKRSIQAVDGSLALRLSYPPDGYKIATQFMTNTRFSWKTNLTLRTVFQVSRKESFTDTVFEEPAKDETRLGKAWGVGTLYWRLSSYNVNGSVFIQTVPRRIEVVDPFPAIQLLQPRPGSSFLLPENQDYSVTWPVTPGADFYKVQVFPGSAGTATNSNARFQSDVEQAAGGANNSLKLPLSTFPDGMYVARIQAFGREKETSTSIIGLYGDSSFTFRRLVYTKLASPADGTKLDGLDARRHGVSFTWITPNPPPNTVFELRNLLGGAVVFRKEISTSPLVIPRLDAGTYEWTVRGSIENFDLSARSPFHLSVSEIPKLAAPSGLNPPDKTVYGPGQLRTMHSLDFSWQPVPGAQVYQLRLFRDQSLPPTAIGQKVLGADRPVFEPKPSTSIRQSFDKLGTLQRGAYYWEVKAITLGADGLVEQDGVVSRAQFTLDLPILSQPKLPQGQTYYGR